MSRNHRRKNGRGNNMKVFLSVGAVALILLVGMTAAYLFDSRMTEKVENAGKQMTAYISSENTAQVFMNGQWHRKKQVETLLVMGIDDFGAVTSSGSYNNNHQADFLVLFIKDKETGENTAIHLNRDTMTDITELGLTGEKVGVQHAQLALAFNYGSGQQDSSLNTVNAVENLLYGIEIDYYMTLTMDAVPIMNDWVDGVSVTILDDLTSVDEALVLGEEVHLSGEQALAYIRTRRGLEDSTNINRMERQRQYANAWFKCAQEKLNSSQEVMNLIMQMDDCHTSNCPAEVLSDFANGIGEKTIAEVYELPGEAVQGEVYMEFYADDEGIQQLVLDIFYEPVTR